MTLDVNGTERDIEDGTTLDALIELLLGRSRGSAAVVDGTVVPRSEWSALVLRDGQRVEIITAVQGG
jgi:sulfur carrier protein